MRGLTSLWGGGQRNGWVIKRGLRLCWTDKNVASAILCVVYFCLVRAVVVISDWNTFYLNLDCRSDIRFNISSLSPIYRSVYSASPSISSFTG